MSRLPGFTLAKSYSYSEIVWVPMDPDQPSRELAPPKTYTKEEINALGRKVSECMLSNSWGLVVGITVGTALTVKRKNLRPFVVWTLFGSFADLVYGYTNSCRNVLNDWERATRKVPKYREVLVEKGKDLPPIEKS